MKDVSKKLDQLLNNERVGFQQYKDYSLKNVEFLLNHFGNPHNRLKAVHIAGTNGKGSVAYMLNHIMITAGYRTGLYISPHLTKINERIKIDNIDIADEMLNRYIDEMFDVLAKNDDINPTYFDALTLIAFRYFYEMNVDIAVIETGLGGRLDSTNIIFPLISIITDISIDHKFILGNSIQEIAQEKAGIIKAETLVVTSNRKKDIINILTKKSDEVSSSMYLYNKDFRVKRVRYLNGMRIRFDYYSRDDCIIKDIELKIPCKFQTVNASLAITSSLLLKRYGFNIGEEEIKKGLHSLIIPGRFHILLQKPLMIFDPAHNIEALKAVIKALKLSFPDKKYSVILSFMKDKDYRSMIKLVKRDLTDHIYYYEIDEERSLKVSELQSDAEKLLFHDIRTLSKMSDLIDVILSDIDGNSLFLITGSFRLYELAVTISSKIQKSFTIDKKD